MKYSVRFVHVEPISNVMHRVRFQRPDDFSFRSGQFINIFIDNKAIRSYSIASDPDSSFIDLIIRFPKGSRARKFLEQLSDRDQIDIMGPFGKYVYKNTENIKVHIVTGAGIGPNFSMLYEAEKRNELQENYVLFGVQYKDNIPYLQQFHKWQKLGLHFYPCLSQEQGDNNKTFSGRVLSVLKNNILSQDKNFLEDKEFYICGQPQMVIDTVKFLLQHGVDKSQIHHESFNASK